MIDENPLPTVEVDESPKPTSKKIDNISKIDKIKNLIKEKIESGFEVKDKNSVNELNKLIVDELKISPGWRSAIKKEIKKYLEDNKISVADKGFKPDKIGLTRVTVSAPEPKTESQTQTTFPTPNSQPTFPTNTDTPTLPAESTQETEEKKYMSETAQNKLIKRGLNDFLVPLYISMGIVEPDDEEKQEEAKLPTAKKFRKDVDGFADELSEYLIENDIKLPAFLNMLSILVSVIAIFIIPAVKFKFFSSKQKPSPKYDKSVDKIEVEV